MSISIVQQGDTTKPAPYTIAFIANPALEAPLGGGAYITDPMPSRQIDFDAAVIYAVACLFGRLPGQAENFMADSRIEPNIRIISIVETGLHAVDQNALAGESPVGRLLSPRRNQIVQFLAQREIAVDVAFVVSASALYTRAAAYGTTDDISRPGTPFTYDGSSRMHWHFADIPGTATLHFTSRALTPMHEFAHAASSYTSGFVTDLYVPNTSAEVNCKLGRPIPGNFATYQGRTFLSDPARDGLGYPPGWQSYHSELVIKTVPAAMDNYNMAGNPLACRHDALTARYLADRLLAKIGR